MNASINTNKRFLLRIWLPAIAIFLFVGGIFFASLTSGDATRVRPAVFGIFFAVVMYFVIRWHQDRKIAKALLSQDPTPYLAFLSKAARRVPNGTQVAAASSATILAFYGRVADAEASLTSVSWETVPPMIQAQATLARAVLAYTQGHHDLGLEHSVAAGQQAAIDPRVPGARTSELAFRNYRNLGLVLLGRDTDTTVQELRTAKGTLPLLGQIPAAWGLAIAAKRRGNSQEWASERAFIAVHAPYFTPVLQSTDAA